jgi:hypothetical protein
MIRERTCSNASTLIAHPLCIVQGMLARMDDIFRDNYDATGGLMASTSTERGLGKVLGGWYCMKDR